MTKQTNKTETTTPANAIESQVNENHDIPVENETEFRVGILSRSGNVGKTTIARMLLAPRMENFDDIIYVESLNADKVSKEGKMVRAGEFEKVTQKLGESISAIVDIGASNLEEMMQLIRQFEGSHEDFDYVIVPVSGTAKEEDDTINTFVDLINMGVDAEKIKVVFNKVGVTANVDETFADVIHVLKKLGIEYNPNAVIYASNFFPNILKSKMSLDQLFATPVETNKKRQTDLRRMKQRTEEENQELESVTKLITLQRSARSAITNLDNVYEALFAK